MVLYRHARPPRGGFAADEAETARAYRPKVPIRYPPEKRSCALSGIPNTRRRSCWERLSVRREAVIRQRRRAQGIHQKRKGLRNGEWRRDNRPLFRRGGFARRARLGYSKIRFLRCYSPAHSLESGNLDDCSQARYPKPSENSERQIPSPLMGEG